MMDGRDEPVYAAPLEGLEIFTVGGTVSTFSVLVSEVFELPIISIQVTFHVIEPSLNEVFDLRVVGIAFVVVGLFATAFPFMYSVQSAVELTASVKLNPNCCVLLSEFVH